MVEFSRSRIVNNPVKPHLCNVCLGQIKKGEQHVYWTGKADDFWSVTLHLSCARKEWPHTIQMAENKKLKRRENKKLKFIKNLFSLKFLYDLHKEPKKEPELCEIPEKKKSDRISTRAELQDVVEHVLNREVPEWKSVRIKMGLTNHTTLLIFVSNTCKLGVLRMEFLPAISEKLCDYLFWEEDGPIIFYKEENMDND